MNSSRKQRSPRRLSRLVGRRYRSASAALRAELLRCLVRPLGTLGLAAIASGAFTVLLDRSGRLAELPFDDLARYSSEQITELAVFVAQVSPDALQQAVRLAFEIASRSV